MERVAESGGGPRGKTADRVIGIDESFAKDRLAEARRAHKGFTILDKGIATTGLPSSSVDAAISWRVLHNLTLPGEWTNTLTEIRRVMKHDAPMVVSVRAAKDWMNAKSPVPTLHRTYAMGLDRDDLYFSELACYAMFRMYGFDIPYKAELFSEEEVVNGQRVSNQYWMLCLVCNKRDPLGRGSAKPIKRLSSILV